MRRALDLTVYIGEDDDAFAVMADLNRMALTHMHQGRDVNVSVYQVIEPDPAGETELDVERVEFESVLPGSAEHVEIVDGGGRPVGTVVRNPFPEPDEVRSLGSDT
jgi:hypothetical protein